MMVELKYVVHVRTMTKWSLRWATCSKTVNLSVCLIEKSRYILETSERTVAMWQVMNTNMGRSWHAPRYPDTIGGYHRVEFHWKRHVGAVDVTSERASRVVSHVRPCIDTDGDETELQPRDRCSPHAGRGVVHQEPGPRWS